MRDRSDYPSHHEATASSNYQKVTETSRIPSKTKVSYGETLELSHSRIKGVSAGHTLLTTSQRDGWNLSSL